MKKKIAHILQSYEIIDFALIFGSYANNKERFLSDIDLAVFTKEEIDIFTVGEIIATLEDACAKPIDLIVLNDLYKTNAKLAFSILDNHQILFCKNHDAYTDFKTKTLQYYFDLSYMYAMFDEAVETRIKNGTYGKAQTS